jgi:hypothetical protein
MHTSTELVSLVSLSHPEFHEAVFTFRTAAVFWQRSHMKIELKGDSETEIYIFPPVSNWTGEHHRTWDRLVQDVFYLPSFSMNDVFARATEFALA